MTVPFQFRLCAPFEFAVSVAQRKLGYVHRAQHTAPYPQWWTGPRSAPSHGPYRSMLEAARNLYHYSQAGAQ